MCQGQVSSECDVILNVSVLAKATERYKCSPEVPTHTTLLLVFPPSLPPQSYCQRLSVRSLPATTGAAKVYVHCPKGCV